MLKKIGWLGKLVAAGLILSFLSIWTTGYIVTSYVDTLLKQFNLPLEAPPMAMSGVWGKLWGADPLLKTDIADKGTETDNGAAGDDHGDPPEAVDAFGQIGDPPITDIGIGGGTQADGGTAPETGGTESGETEAGEDAGETGTEAEQPETEETGTEPDNGASEAGAEEEASGIDGSETAMTTEELTEVKEQMSDEDKEQLFALLMAKLPQESMQTISQYVENGLTEQELTSIQQIMAQHLDKEEYEQMMAILKKY